MRYGIHGCCILSMQYSVTRSPQAYLQNHPSPPTAATAAAPRKRSGHPCFALELPATGRLPGCSDKCSSSLRPNSNTMAAEGAAAAARLARGVVHVSLHNYDEAVALDPLTQDAYDVVELLSAEAAPIPVWLDAAKAFLAQGNVEACESVLNEANSADVIDGIRQLYNKEPIFEIVQLNCALAAIRLEEARLQRDPSLFDKAQQHVEAAKAVRSGEMLPDMMQGLLELNKNNTDDALRAFQAASKKLHSGSKNHAPLLAQASVYFNSGNISKAHQLYAQVLRENPKCPAEVRLGLAACLYRGGKLERASAAYKRVLELDPESADALLGLAMIAFGSTNVQEGLNSGLQYLQRAYAADAAHPGVLCVLSHFSMLKGMYEEGKQLAEAALLNADTSRLRVAAHVLLGRCCHALGDFSGAQQHYGQATRLDPSQPLAHLGTAQVYLAASGEVPNVVSELELVLKALPGNTDAMQLLGGLLSVLPERVSKTMQAHKEVLLKRTEDATLQEYVGDLLAAADPAASLDAFGRALGLYGQRQEEAQRRNAARAAKRQQLLELQGQPGAAEAQALLDELGEDEEVPRVPAKLLNNTAVLKYRAGQMGEALQLMQQATQNMTLDGTTAAQMVTMGYNLARLQEASGDVKAASKAYQELIEQFPGYIDCYLRLSALARAAGDMDKAREWADAATQQAGGDVDAQALLATIYLQRGDNQAARKCIAKAEANSPAAKSDPYLRLTHANIIMNMLPKGRYSSLKDADKAKHSECIHKALGLYREVIRLQPDNIYALNGVGTCLAELGHLAAAKEAFNQVIRATSRTKGFVKLPEAYVNMGHLGLAKRQYADALRMYELAGRLNTQRDIKVVTLIARAHHDATEHMAARRALARGLHMFPTDLKLRFNMAFVLQEQALKLFKRSYVMGDPQKLEDFTVAMKALTEAGRLFTQLVSMGEEGLKKGGLDIKKVTMHANFCTENIPKCAVALEEARTEVYKASLKQQLKQAELKAAEEQRRIEEHRRSAAEQKEKQRKEENAKRALEEARAKVAELHQQRRLANLSVPEEGGDGEGGEGGKAAAKSRKRKKGAAAAAADEAFYVDDDTPIERLPKKNVKAELKRGGLDSDEEEEAAGVNAGDLFGSDGDDDGDFDPDAADTGGSGGGTGAGGRPAVGGRLRRGTAAAGGGGAGGGDEQMGETDAGQPAAVPLEDDLVFAPMEIEDGDMQDEFDDAAEQQQQPQRRRQRQQQALESDEEGGDEPGPGAAEGDVEAAAAAAAAGEDDAMDDLF